MWHYVQCRICLFLSKHLFYHIKFHPASLSKMVCEDVVWYMEEFLHSAAVKPATGYFVGYHFVDKKLVTVCVCVYIL